MIEVKGLIKSYSGIKVYDNFDFTAESGKITCILGESGGGKTTLLNCIAGLTECSGNINVNDCSYVFQTPRLVPNLTVSDNLKLVCRDDGAINDMLAKLKLTDKADSYPVSLSGGQAQRVALARAFLYGGDTILMDEPFSSLDLKLKSEMISIFFGMWRTDNRTVLMVTHDVEEALIMAHRIVVLKAGKIIHDAMIDGEPPRSYGADGAIRQKLVSALLS